MMGEVVESVLQLERSCKNLVCVRVLTRHDLRSSGKEASSTELDLVKARGSNADRTPAILSDGLHGFRQSL